MKKSMPDSVNFNIEATTTQQKKVYGENWHKMYMHVYAIMCLCVSLCFYECAQLVVFVVAAPKAN